MKRRAFLPFLLTPAIARVDSQAYAQADSAPAMRITRIDTTYFRPGADLPWKPNWVWVRVHTNSGLVGIGETYPRNEAEASLVHSSVAGMLLGRDSRDIERIWADFYRTFDFQITGGAEMRVLSAIDLALWDLLGKSLNVPAYRLLGGKSNPEIRLYNTCFGHRYDFNKEPEKIMHELIDRYGIKAIKIWPFDGAALRNQHEYVTMADIDEGLGPVRKLRDTFGNDIEILMEFRLLNAPTYGQPAGMKATKREISIAQGMYNVRQGKLLCRKKGIRTYEDHTLFPQKIPGCNGRIGWIVASSPCFVFGPLSSRRPGCRGDVS